MSWTAVDPRDTPTQNLVLMPIMLCSRDTFAKLFNGMLDTMTSDPRTLDVLCQLVSFTQPKILVEVGTYRGIGTAALAESLDIFGFRDSHIWTCNPEDFSAGEFIDKTGLTPYVTVVQGTFEELLPLLPAPMNFCYIDASAYDEPGLRLRYAKLALEHAAPGCIIAVDDAAADWRGSKTLRRMANLYLPQHRGLAIFVK